MSQLPRDSRQGDIFPGRHRSIAMLILVATMIVVFLYAFWINAAN